MSGDLDVQLSVHQARSQPRETIFKNRNFLDFRAVVDMVYFLLGISPSSEY
jgi:hypothetical protein